MCVGSARESDCYVVSNHVIDVLERNWCGEWARVDVNEGGNKLVTSQTRSVG